MDRVVSYFCALCLIEVWYSPSTISTSFLGTITGFSNCLVDIERVVENSIKILMLFRIDMFAVRDLENPNGGEKTHLPLCHRKRDYHLNRLCYLFLSWDLNCRLPSITSSNHRPLISIYYLKWEKKNEIETLSVIRECQAGVRGGNGNKLIFMRFTGVCAFKTPHKWINPFDEAKPNETQLTCHQLIAFHKYLPTLWVNEFMRFLRIEFQD